MTSLNFTCLDGQLATYSNDLTLTATHEVVSVNANPATVWFEVTSVTGADADSPGPGPRDPQYHDILYQWDFGDAANATPTTPLNMPDEWKDLNKGYGREVCHVYNDGGTHSVTVYAYEPATRRFGSLTFDVVIEDANTVFAGDKTIIFNPDNLADVSAFPSANVVTTTWEDARAARDAKGQTDCRLLIAPGVTLIDTQLALVLGWSNCRIGGLDPAVKPVIQMDTAQHTGNASIIRDWEDDNREFVLYGLDFRGPWDAATETGRILDPFSIRKSSYDGNFAVLYNRCNFSGFEALRGCFLFGTTQNTYHVWNDCDITNWQNYGIFSGQKGRPKTAVIGCAVHQHEDALSGGLKDKGYNQHGPVRDTRSPHVYISVCDLFSRNGWSHGGTDDAGYLVTSDQPALRINTNGEAGKSSYVDRVAAEGYLNYEEQNSSKIDRPGNHVLDKVLQVLGSRGNLQFGVQTRFGGTTIRNMLGIKLNLPEAVSTTFQRFLHATNEDGAPDNDEEVAVYNATLLDLRNDTNARDSNVAIYHGPDELFGNNGDFSNLVLENNVFVQPNRTGVNRDDEPLDLTTPVPGFTPRHKGPAWNFLPYQTSLAAPVSGAGGTLDIPYADIKDTRANRGEVDDGSPTNQTYWQANEGADTRHRVAINANNATTFHADTGDIAVDFGVSGITITNNSGTDWNGGDLFILRLDRSSLLAPFDPQFNSQGQTIPLAVPLAGSAALGSGNAGKQAYDDLLLRVRPDLGGHSGAICLSDT